MTQLRWTRIDQVLLEGVLWALPAALCVGVAIDAVHALRGRPLEVTGLLPDTIAPTTGLVQGPMTGTVVVQDATAAQYAWDLASSLFLLLLAVVVARLLLGVARSLRLGDPFTQANARRLATLGTVLIVGGTLHPLVQGVSLNGVLRPLALDAPTTWSLDLALWPAMTGILLGFLAEVFSRGARLREDVEGLV